MAARLQPILHKGQEGSLNSNEDNDSWDQIDKPSGSPLARYHQLHPHRARSWIKRSQAQWGYKPKLSLGKQAGLAIPSGVEATSVQQGFKNG